MISGAYVAYGLYCAAILFGVVFVGRRAGVFARADRHWGGDRKGEVRR